MFEIVITIITDVTKEYGPAIGFATGLVYICWRNKTKFFTEWIKDEKVENKINVTVKTALHSILWKLEADRVFLFEYSGYDERIKPIPFTHTDNTVEIVSPATKVKSHKEDLQRIPLSSIPVWIERLSCEGEILISNIENIRNQDFATYEILKSQHIKSVYAVSLVDFRGTPLGFVGVDYCEECVEIDEKDIKILKYEALKIAGLLVLKRNGSLDVHK